VEWVQDCYAERYGEASERRGIRDAELCVRVLRGGGWAVHGGAPERRPLWHRFCDPKLLQRFPCRQDALNLWILGSLPLDANHYTSIKGEDHRCLRMHPVPRGIRKVDRQVPQQACRLSIVLAVVWPFDLARAQRKSTAVARCRENRRDGAATKTGTASSSLARNGYLHRHRAHVVEGADRISVFFFERPSTAMAGIASKIQASDPRV